jgi:23S rRNA (uracil747-C5)-methyltransferase
MGRDYDDQLALKHAAAVRAVPGVRWDPPVANAERAYRNRAKLAVGGDVEAPTLGVLDDELRGVDLTSCGLYEPSLAASFEPLRRFVTVARLEPYDVVARRGELKYLLVTVSPDGDLMVRFVLRSTEAVARVRKHLGWLTDRVTGLVVVSVNVQPVHAQLLEGEEEIVLTATDHLVMRVGDVSLVLPPRSFFQTSSAIAGALYRQARQWVDEVAPTSIWDLYCGVGGFAASLAAPGRRVLGVEVAPAAIDAARRSGADADFVVGDALGFARSREDRPDLVVVNPPRRGLGAELAGWIEGSGVRHVLYSSCHLGSLERDLALMPRLRPVRARVLDMFPQTSHAEMLVLLTA